MKEKKPSRKTPKQPAEKNGRTRGTRLIPDRQEEIHHMLKRRFEIPDPRERLISAHKLVQVLFNEIGIVVDVKTIRRDIEEMITRRRLPIESVIGRYGGYRYTEAVTEFPGIHLTKSELFVLCLAVQALAAYRNTNFETPIRWVIKKLLKLIQGDIEIDLARLESMISFRPGPHESPVDLEVFDQVCNALLNQKELAFQHVKPEQPDKPMLRRVQPLHLCVYAYAWYLFCNDLTHKTSKDRDRTFALARIKDAKETDAAFLLESPFDIDEKLEHCFGIDRRGKPVDIRLRFSPAVRQFVTERHWHKSQRFVLLENGGIDLLLHVRPTAEVIVWIGGWRKDCIVMEPISLAQQVRDELREQLAAYSWLPETNAAPGSAADANH